MSIPNISSSPKNNTTMDCVPKWFTFHQDTYNESIDLVYIYDANCAKHSH